MYVLSKTNTDSTSRIVAFRGLLHKYKFTLFFLVLLVTIVSTITYFRILAQIEIGPISDSFDFLSNALVYAGQGMGYADLLRPPFFGFLISIIFRMGYVSTNVVFYMDGLMFIFGVIGLYFLLKLRFNDLESFLGALLYATFPIVITILGVGFSDITSVSFTIWAIYFTVLSVQKDSKYFYLSIPLLMIAFLTRYNNALLIFPILLYLLINKGKINFKQMIIGIVISLAMLVPVLIFFFQKYGDILYPFINFGTNSATLTSSTETFAYNPNIFFFVQNFPSAVGLQGIFIMLIILVGVVIFCFYKFFTKKSKENKTLNLKLSRLTKIKIVILIITLTLFLGTFGKIFYMINEVLFFIIGYLTFDITRNLNIKHFDMSLLFLAWFMVFFILNSIYVIKDLRYFILMAPPIAYFMILGLSKVSKRINIQFRNRNIVFSILAIILVAIMLISTASQIPMILSSNNNKVILNKEIIQSSQWFTEFDPNYKDQNIFSDLGPNYSWYLKTDVKTVPVFKDNQTFANGVKNETFNQADSDQYNNFLITNNADYYICLREGLNLTSYTAVKQMGDVTIYKRNN